MLILGIETSCDETAAAILEFTPGGFKIIAEEISSQVELHRAYGGVVPELASREHLTNLPLVLQTLFSAAGLTLSDVNLIGVTAGPGLKGCLLMGVSFAKGLCLGHALPLIGVNHIEGHIHSACLCNPEINYPYLALVVSGGHTEVIEVLGLGQYRIVARTIDDAAGEAFDKSAHLLGFPYPGGPLLAKLADQQSSCGIKFPLAMRDSPDFSFSGLKTAIALKIREYGPSATQVGQSVRAELAAAIQSAIVESLCFKVRQAVKSTAHRRLVVAGGVSANSHLRRELAQIPRLECHFPELRHCMDNGAMIALTAAKRFLAGGKDGMALAVRARWPVEELRRL